ncbi:hypothetical protein [Myceligenerans indicum]|uniref:Uncharacterized protein n=1 Tax=Myceligenerans indicum TaxID=2593663 RepID=A0ABS1LPU0_9MICO|nr:hypothetical protein [Myceligenerans indicum]MBL0888280.1 hypothetical protein [Myceligenerans indicum]
MQERAHHVDVSGSGNAVNIGGSNNSATVNAHSNGQDAIESAVRAIRALAADLEGPAKVALEFGADDIESTSDETRRATSLRRVQNVIDGVSASVTTAAGAASAVGAAIRALGL